MMQKVVLGIDLGTTYYKVGIFDRDGRLLGLGREPVELENPAPGKVELSPDSFRNTLRRGLKQALQQAGLPPQSIMAAGYSSQANTFILLDSDERPLTPFIIWTDRRAEAVPELEALWNRNDFTAVTGMSGGGPSQAVNKMCWMMRREPLCVRTIGRMLTLSDYLVWTLTGEAYGDAGTASLLGLLDVKRGEWWPPALTAAGLNKNQLARPLPPGSPAGRVTREGAAFLGLPEGIPLAAGSLDHYTAALGAGIGQVAPFSCSIGTVLALVAALDEFEPRPGCITGPGVQGITRFNQMAYDMNGGSVLEWYQRTHAPQHSFAEIDRLAATVPPGAEGLLARPSADRYAQLDGFYGLTARHGIGHQARAICESTAATLAELLERLAPPNAERAIAATGGGASSDFWLQLMADLADTRMVRVDCREPACLGAALMAATVCEWFTQPSVAAASWVKPVRSFVPDPDKAESYRHWRRRRERLLADKN